MNSRTRDLLRKGFHYRSFVSVPDRTRHGEEIRARPDAPWVPVLAAAVNRFFQSRIKRKHVMRTAKQSVAFVAAEG